MILPLGRRSLRAGSTPGIFFVTSLLIVLGFRFYVKNSFLAVDGSRTNSECCFWDCGNLFWEVLGLFYPFVRFFLALVGAHFGRVRLPYFYGTNLLIVSGFVLFATDSNFSGRRESNKSMILILGRWKLFLGEARPF